MTNSDRDIVCHFQVKYDEIYLTEFNLYSFRCDHVPCSAISVSNSSFINFIFTSEEVYSSLQNLGFKKHYRIIEADYDLNGCFEMLLSTETCFTS